MSLGRTLTYVAAVSLLLGVVMIGLSIRMPAFTNPEAASEHLAQYPSSQIRADRAQDATYTADWRAQMDALSTDKWPLFDRGAALVAFGLCAGMAATVAFLKGVRSFASLSSPRNRWCLVGLGVVGMWLVLAGGSLSLYLDYERGRIPPWQDSGVVAVLHGTLPAAALFTLPVTIVGALLVLRARLPVSLLSWDRSRVVLSVSTLVVFLLLLGLVPVLLASASTSSGGWLALPGCLLWVYVVASTRAAMLSWK